MRKSLSSSQASDSKADKKQKMGGTSNASGLLKFGFTGSNVKSEPVASPSAIEYSQCPHCSGLFSTLSIVEHAISCSSDVKGSQENSNNGVELSQGGEGSQQSRTNAFELMRKSAALKPQSTAPAVMHFALILKDEKLLPVFSSSADYIEQLYAQCQTNSDQPPNWTCEANVKKFRWNFVSVESSHRDMRLHVSTNIQPDANVSFADTAPISTAWLKSMLQKAVRRKLSHKAVKLANMMCKTNPVNATHSKSMSPAGSPIKSKPYPPATNARNTKFNNNPSTTAANNTTLLSELLRRLPIICIEDAALHPAYSLLIWLMVAVSKGYTPPKCLIHIVLLVTHDIASCTFRDCTPPYEYDLAPRNSTTNVVNPDPSTFTPNTAHTTNTTNTTNTSNTTNTGNTTTDTTAIDIHSHSWEGIENDSVRTLLACICIRASFGGMTGDMVMLDKYAQLWYNRLLCDNATTSSSGSSTSGLSGMKSISECIDCYLHSSYTSAFFSNSSGALSWASPMYENFNTGYTSSTTNIKDVYSENSSITTVVERVLIRVCSQYTNSNTNTNTTNNTFSATTRPTATLPTLLRLTQYDLVPEGLDQHCDYSLVPAVLNMCNDKVNQLILETQTVQNDTQQATITLLKDPHLEANIKSAIWLFRSSNNSRKLYPHITNNAAHHPVNLSICTYNQELIDTDLAQKRKLARMWGVVCPMIVAYCERKMVALAHRL